jgi:hypothetical protein
VLNFSTNFTWLGSILILFYAANKVSNASKDSDAAKRVSKYCWLR